jgi:hypothetical protein
MTLILESDKQVIEKDISSFYFYYCPLYTGCSFPPPTR